MKPPATSIAIGVLFLICSTNLFALSCPKPDFEKLYESNRHIFVAKITKKLVVDTVEYDPQRNQDILLAEFEVIETIKGEPENINQIVTSESGVALEWLEAPDVEKTKILLTNSDENVRWFLCSDGFYPRHCNLYAFRKLAGSLEEEDTVCDFSLLRLKMWLKGFKPVSNSGNSDDLRKEWYEAFGEWPED